LKRQKNYQTVQANELATRARLSQMQDQQNLPFWRELQQGRYPNSYSITPIESIQDVLVNNKNTADKIDNASNIIAVNEQAKNHVMIIFSEFDPNDKIAIN